MKYKKTFKDNRWERRKNHNRYTNDGKDIPTTKKIRPQRKLSRKSIIHFKK